MNRNTWMLWGLAALMLVLSPALAQKGAPAGDKTDTVKGGDKADDGLAAMQAAMVKECALTPEQTTKLNDRVNAYKDAMANWQKENAEKIAAVLKAGKGDPQVREDAAALSESKAKLNADLKKDIEAILTEDQRAKWDAYQLYTATCQAYGKASLTDAQLTKVREFTAQAAKELFSTTEKEMQATIRTDLAAKIDALLTADQKAAMAKKKVAASEPAGDKPPKGSSK